MNNSKKYLEILSRNYPTIISASTEIINLQSILNLPKGTEHFMSDIHGEYDAFSHVLRNGSGAVRKKIDDVFGHTLEDNEKASLATLIYYPTKKIEIERKSRPDMDNWYRVALYRLIEVCKTVSSKYTRSKVRKAMPQEFAYIIEELITEKPEVLNKEAYYDAIVNTIVDIGSAENFIVALCKLIQQLVIDHLHILGDIYDRGAGPHFIMDRLENYHSLDIQWGNHDVVWMGAAVGHPACVANVIRNCIAYGNQDILEDGYGISMFHLASFAMDKYANVDCECFKIRDDTRDLNEAEVETELEMKMHKAIMVILMKLEGQLIAENPSFDMDDRRILHRIDPKEKTVLLYGKTYKMKDCDFPTIDWNDPYHLTEEEQDVMNKFISSFRHCEKLQRHINLMLKKGNLYKIYNGNLLYHGCIPMDEQGRFKKVDIFGKKYSGKKLYDVLEEYIRKAFFSLDKDERKKGADILWFLWCAPLSPLFGRSKMSTFERYFLDDADMKVEKKNPYYRLYNDPEIADRILREFGLSGDRVHIINGHVPVKLTKGESPVKAGGKLFVIDGGFSRAYRKTTGIAGYTLVFNSYGLTLTAHEPFVSAEEAVLRGLDIVSRQENVVSFNRRLLVGDTDFGDEIKERIEDLKELVNAYRLGVVHERGQNGIR